jgi:PEGA domain-containing protein
VTGMRASQTMIAICAVGVVSVAHATPEIAGEVRAGDGCREDGAVVVGGGAEDHALAATGTAAMAVARSAGWSLPREPVSAKDAAQLLDCSQPDKPWACVPASIDRRGVRRIFVFAVDPQQTDSGAPMVVLTGRLIGTAPQALVVRQRFCEHCADDRLSEVTTALARQLLQDLAVRSGRTILDVESTPPGAWITLDGRPIGATNATFNTFPGAHVVIVGKAGYRSETRTALAEEDRTAQVAVTLVPVLAAAPAARSGRWVSGGLIGGGALAAAAGGVLLDLGARGGPNDKYRYAGATPAGVVIGVAGAGALVTGIYLWWRASASSTTIAGPTLGLAVGPTVGMTSSGSAVAGWALAF